MIMLNASKQVKILQSTLFLVIVVTLTIAGLPTCGYSNSRNLSSDLSVLSGKVFNTATEPIRAAEVRIGDNITWTDLHGYYELHKVKLGWADVVVSAPGYESDQTRISIHQRFVEFSTTLTQPTTKEKTLEVLPLAAPAPLGNLYGISGGIELPDIKIYPLRSYSLSYNLFRTKKTGTGSADTITYASLGGSITEQLEGAVFVRENRDQTAQALMSGSLSGFQLKYRGEINIGDKKQAFVAGATNFQGETDEIYLALDVPFLDGHHITLVPTLNSATRKIMFNLGLEYNLYQTSLTRTALLLEALQSDGSDYDRFNAGIRLQFKDTHSFNFFMLNDTKRNYRSMGVGASLLFQ